MCVGSQGGISNQAMPYVLIRERETVFKTDYVPLNPDACKCKINIREC